jgi:pre-mRNA 3'-end-processing factor FIP1
MEPVDGMEEEQEENSVDKKSGGDAGSGGDSDEDSDDDDINVVIGDIKSGPSYNLKPRAQILNTAVAANEKTKTSTGKFSIEEFESVGTINGQPAHEFAMETIEEKPWRKPGSDITDYFNYGFNEDTWRAYCERQKKMRVVESGIGLSSLSANVQPTPHHGHNPLGGRPGPPGRRITSIDVIGSAHNRERESSGYHHSYGGPPSGKKQENVIQVMTADRREYSRTVTGNKFDSAMPPPFEQELLPDPFFTGEDPFAYGYEPTQDSQWDPSQAPAPAWAPTGVKELTGSHIQQMIPSHGGMMVPPQMMMGGPHMSGHSMMPPGGARGREDRDRDRNRDRGDGKDDRDDKDRDRNRRDRDKHRERERERDG